MAATLEGGDGRRQKGQQIGFRGEGRELCYDIAIELRIYNKLYQSRSSPLLHPPPATPPYIPRAIASTMLFLFFFKKTTVADSPPPGPTATGHNPITRSGLRGNLSPQSHFHTIPMNRSANVMGSVLLRQQFRPYKRSSQLDLQGYGYGSQDHDQALPRPSILTRKRLLRVSRNRKCTF